MGLTNSAHPELILIMNLHNELRALTTDGSFDNDMITATSI